MRWIFLSLIGLGSGLVAIFVDYSIDQAVHKLFYSYSIAI